MTTIELSHEQLERLVDALDSAIGMMEPYYTQCGADKELVAIGDEFRNLLPYVEAISPFPDCPKCGKRCNSIRDILLHMKAAHKAPLAERKAAERALRPRQKTWNSKAEYFKSKLGEAK